MPMINPPSTGVVVSNLKKGIADLEAATVTAFAIEFALKSPKFKKEFGTYCVKVLEEWAQDLS